MSSNKKYYWFKQKTDFFNNPRLKKLRNIAGGDTYLIIYQKIMLYSIKNEGLINFEGIEDTISDELALILDEKQNNVEVTLTFMAKYGLIEQITKTSFLVSEIPSLIGSEGSSAERMRKHRELQASQCDSIASQCDTELENKRIRVKSKRIRVKSKKLDKEKKINKTKKDFHFPSSHIETEIKNESMEIAIYLHNKISDKKPNFKEPNLNIWAGDIEKAIKLDSRTKEQLLGCIDWIYTNKGSFWIPNILSGKKLREKFDTMEIQMMNDPQKKSLEKTANILKDLGY